LVLAVQSFILSAPSADNIGGEIANGDLSNYLVKPISYLKYWFTRDVSSKLLNFSFAAAEVSLLWFFLRPQLHVTPSLTAWLAFLIICVLAVFIYYFLNVSARFVAFWTPESTWGVGFLVLVFLEIVSGMIFPLDILPKTGQIVLQFTPFPYLIYYPIAIFVGKITGWEIIRILLQALIWLVAMLKLSQVLWHQGLKVYGSEGR